MVQPLWKLLWRFLKKLKIELYNSAILLLGIDLKKKKRGGAHRKPYFKKLFDMILIMLNFVLYLFIIMCLVAQLCPSLWDSMNCSPPGFFVHEDFQSKNTGVDCHALLQEIFPTQ